MKSNIVLFSQVIWRKTFYFRILLRNVNEKFQIRSHLVEVQIKNFSISFTFLLVAEYEKRKETFDAQRHFSEAMKYTKKNSNSLKVECRKKENF